MNYNLEKMLMTLGYTERGSKCIITRRKRELNLFIEDNTSVSEENVIKILDTSPRKGIASMIMRLEEFIHEEVLEEASEEIPSTPSEEEETVPQNIESMDSMEIKRELQKNINRGISDFPRKARKNGRGKNRLKKRHR